MQLKEFIETGAAKAGSLTALGRMLGISQPDMSNAKAMKKPLPAKAIVQLSEYINADLKALIAANELVTEKDEAKREFWRPFAEHARAASIAMILALVTNLVTQKPADAAPRLTTTANRLCIMSNRVFKNHLKQCQLFREILVLMECLHKPLFTMLKGRIFQM